jgi:hypothetical protein
VTKIRILPDILSNKIAAGEVVERPGSVVKELVENALDAQSTQVLVEIENGGKSLIRISDNGCGMGHDDALLAIEGLQQAKFIMIMTFLISAHSDSGEKLFQALLRCLDSPWSPVIIFPIPEFPLKSMVENS